MLTDGSLAITDPIYVEKEPTWLERKFTPLVRDVRDLPFVKLSLMLTASFIPLAAVIFATDITWYLAPVYVALYLFFLGPFVLMLHNTSHRVLFKRDYNILNKYIPWIIGPFLGQSPETYFVHHMAMHHQEGNLVDDLSSTMKFQRDSFIDFMKYFLTFFFFGQIQLCSYLLKRGKRKLVRRFLVGELSAVAVIALALVIKPSAAIVVFVIPFVLTRFLLMAGNWAQHAFVDPEDWANDYKTVITFINSHYNHRCFNDGYHLGHHLKAGRHWTDMPADFLAKKDEIIAQGSLVFRKLDYFAIFLLLMFKQHRRLTNYVVQLDESNQLSEDQLLELFHRRLKRFDVDNLVETPAAA